MFCFLSGETVAVSHTDLVGNATPLHVLLRRNHQGELVSERTGGFWKQLAVVSWIVSRLLILLYCSVQLSRMVYLHPWLHACIYPNYYLYVI